MASIIFCRCESSPSVKLPQPRVIPVSRFAWPNMKLNCAYWHPASRNTPATACLQRQLVTGNYFTISIRRRINKPLIYNEIMRLASGRRIRTSVWQIKIRCLTTWRRPKLRRGRPGWRNSHKAASAAPQHACDDIPRRRQTLLTFRRDFVCHTAQPARRESGGAPVIRETGGWGPFIVTHRPARRCAGG